MVKYVSFVDKPSLFFPNDYYDHAWTDLIYYFKNPLDDESLFIYYKKYYVCTIQNKELYDNSFIFNVIQTTIETIKNKGIKLSIYSLPDIIGINKNIDILNKNNMLIPISKLQITFSISNDFISFYLKGQLIYGCDTEKIDAHLNNIEKVYREIEKTKIKAVLYTGERYIRGVDAEQLQYALWNKNIWLDVLSSRYDDDIRVADKRNSLFFLYDILIYDSTTFSYIIEFFDKYQSHGIESILENKIFISLRSSCSWDTKIANEEYIAWKRKNSAEILSKLRIDDKILAETEHVRDLAAYIRGLRKLYTLKMNNVQIQYQNEYDVLCGTNPDKIEERTKTLESNRQLRRLLKNESTNLFEKIQKVKKISPYDIMCKYFFIDVGLLKKMYTITTDMSNLFIFSKLKNIHMIVHKMRKLGNTFGGPLIGYDFTSDDILSRDNFCKVLGLDKTKKNVTLFCGWPQNIHDGIDAIFEKKMINDINFYKTIFSAFHKLGYNVLVKPHPNYEMIIDNNNLKFKTTKMKAHVEKMTKIPNEHIQKIMSECGAIFVDFTYNRETFKYTDFGIVIGATTFGLHSYLFDIPLLCITSKLTKHEGKLMGWEEAFTAPEYGVTNMNILKYYYGEFVDWESIESNFYETAKKFVETDHKKNYKYFENHPLYGKTYYSSSFDISETIDKIIKSQNVNYINLGRSKIPKMFVNPESFIVYDKKNINVNMNYNNELCDFVTTIKILSTPNDNYGVNFRVGSWNEYDGCTIHFDAKIDAYESDDIFIKIYTGQKWIQLETKLCEEYARYTVKYKFRFNARSQWRISTSSKKLGQCIYIRNINVTSP
jgi:hypothetical protein